jgi:hypothetical protein
MDIANSKCPPLDTLITNFQKYVENEINTECSYIKEGTLHYIEYDIPTAYIGKYGSKACSDILSKFLESPEINRKPFIVKKPLDSEPYQYKSFKYSMFITENMYAYYKYSVDDDFNNSDKYFVNCNSDSDSGIGIGILFPVVIKKTVSETVDETVDETVSEPVGEPVSEPVGEPVGEPVSETVSETENTKDVIDIKLQVIISF